VTDQPPQGEPATRSLGSKILWPGIIFVLLGGQVLLMFVMVYLATSDGSFAVEPDYYQKALHWEATARQRQANRRLGWQAAFELGDQVGTLGQRTLTLLLLDRDGEPVNGAAVDLVAFPHARGSQRTSAVLRGQGNGRYSADLRFQRQGLWELRLAVSSGSDTFTHTEKRDIYPPGQSRPWKPR
jgi:nitrogen fixation protein FixH